MHFMCPQRDSQFYIQNKTKAKPNKNQNKQKKKKNITKKQMRLNFQEVLIKATRNSYSKG